MDFALSTYMSHTGIRLRDARPSSTAEKAPSAPDKDKWLPFFPKTKKVSGLPRKVPPPAAALCTGLAGTPLGSCLACPPPLAVESVKSSVQHPSPPARPLHPGANVPVRGRLSLLTPRAAAGLGSGPPPDVCPLSQQSSNSKKEKDALEDKKRNPILKYIGKPKSSSQSSECREKRPGRAFRVPGTLGPNPDPSFLSVLLVRPATSLQAL